MSRIDAKFQALRDQGFTGSISDMTLQWLQFNGATSNCISDAWKEFLQIQLQPATVDVYVNPTLSGGAASGPVAGNFPPDNHGIGFNTADSGPHANGWEMNPLGDSGRCYLSYAIGDNNPGHPIGTLLSLFVDIEQVAGAGTNALGFSGASNIDLVDSDSRVEIGERRIVTALYAITGAGYAAQLRIGLGITSNRAEHWIVHQPVRLEIVVEPIVFPGARNDLWYELLGNLGFEGTIADRSAAFWAAGGVLP